MEKIEEIDYLKLQIAELTKQLALARLQNADLQQKYLTSQMYLKYKLYEGDSILENGEIKKIDK